MLLRPLLLSLTLVIAASPAGAAEITGRYVLEKVEQGFLRLDSQTGVMSLCAAPSGVWECAPIKDEGLDRTEELTRLRNENDTLRKRLAELDKGAPTAKLPNDQEVDRMMDIFGKMFDRFLDFAREMDGRDKSGTAL